MAVWRKASVHQCRQYHSVISNGNPVLFNHLAATLRGVAVNKRDGTYKRVAGDIN